jgi:4'-phosphopantetheinyl transferase
MDPSYSPLVAGEVRVWIAAPDTITSPEILARYEQLLDTDEQERYRRFKFDRDRKEYLVAHALLRQSLSQCAPVAPAAWRFQRNTYGRPEIRVGTGDSRLRFNLSHTRGLSACAVTQDFDIGIDVEWRNRQVNPEELMDLVFSPAEAKALRSLPLPDQSQRFFVLWTLKEAYIKARGMGLALPLDKFTFSLQNESDVRVEFDPSLGDDPAAWQFHLEAPTPAHRLALAIRCGGLSEMSVHVQQIGP